jgi:hypothetical protein
MTMTQEFFGSISPAPETLFFDSQAYFQLILWL